MTERFLEVIFRNKLLLLLPIALGFAGAFFVVSQDTEPEYLASATVWVEYPSDLTGGGFTDFNPYASPAQNQAGSMYELLGTRSFVTRVLDRLDGPPATGSHLDSRYDQIRSKTGIYPSGTHVLYVQHRAATPEEAMRGVEAIVGEYAALYLDQILDRAARSETFYGELFNEASVTLEESLAELRLYAAAHPELEDVDLTDPPSSALEDLEFGRLLSTALTARENYESLLDRYAASQFSAVSANETNPNFVVLDEPLLPTAPIRPSRRSYLVPAMASVLVGMFASSAIFFLRWRLDRIVRLPSDLAYLSPDIQIVTLPALRSRRWRWPRSFVRLAAALRGGLKDTTAAA